MPQQLGAVAGSSDITIGSDSSSEDELVFYPAYCYKASPTWFTWVKLTAYDIHHHLRARRDLQAVPSFARTDNAWPQSRTLLLFYLNHPIQFVQLVGVVVTFEDYFEKFWLFTLDDSSGATIEVNCRKPEQSIHGKDEENDHSDGTKQEVEARSDILGKLDVGSVVQVKGQIGTFRNVRQLQLERIAMVKDTNHEVRLIAARADFHTKVLSIAWTLSAARQKHLHKHAMGENEGQEDRKQKRLRYEQMLKDRENHHSEKILRQYEREEQKRRQGAEDARKAGQMIKARDFRYSN